MNPDDVTRLWRSQDRMTRISIDPELLLKEVRRNDRSLRSKTILGDVLAVVVGILAGVLYFYLAHREHTWLRSIPGGLVGLSLLYVGAFLVFFRIRRRRRMPVFSESLVGCIEQSLERINQQIWLAENVVWWVCLPLGVAFALQIGDFLWTVSGAPWWLQLASVVILFGVAVGAVYTAYLSERRDLRNNLRPRQEELKALLDALKTCGE